jgi:O-antigen/teichoic acid export membrane protein
MINAANVLLQAFMLYTVMGIKSFLPKFHLLRNKALFHTNMWYWLQSIIALLGYLSDRIFIGQAADMKTVGYYSIAVLIGIQIHNALLAFGQFLFPKVSAYRQLDKSIKQLYYDSRFLINGLGWMVIVCALMLGDYLFPLWLGEETFKESIAFIKLYLSFESLILLIIVPFHFINGSNDLRLNTYFELILRSSHVIGMLLGFYIAQVTGLIWGMIISTLINLPFQYYVFHKNVIGLTSIKEAILPVVPAIFLIAAGVSSGLFIKLLSILLFVITFSIIFYRKSGLNVLRLINRRA